MDSIALAYLLRPSICYTVNYGQRSADGEIRAAAAVASNLKLSHRVLNVDCAALGSGALSSNAALVIAPVPEWWPYRNQLLVTVVAMDAVGRGVTELVLGAVRSDARHADGAPAFIDALDRLLSMQEGELRLTAPAIELTSADLIRKARIPKSLLAYAHSCHTGAFACGECPGCIKHLEVTASLYGPELAY